MSCLRTMRRSGVMVAATAALLAASAAQAGPGVHGGGHFAGGFHGGWHGSPGWRGYGWPHHGWGWGWGWGCCGWGWGWGWGWPWAWGLGWYLPVLPLGYQTYWWNGVPYYYANNGYYVWNAQVGQYEAVAPPENDNSDARGSYAMTAPQSRPPGTPSASAELFAYPKAGQSEAQQAKDREECRQWAATQSGFDPGSQTTAPRGNADKRAGYLRAQTACLEGRNYSVR